MPRRIVKCADAREWLAKQKRGQHKFIITSLPEMSELGMDSREQYEAWFLEAAKQVCYVVGPDGYAIFYQTDRRLNGQIVDKAGLLFLAALHYDMRTVWHKIAEHRDAGKVDLYRPGYSHLICFSKNGSAGKAYPDIFPPERSTWANGMPATVTYYACAFAANKGARYIVDPFCGKGTVLAVANDLKLDAYGIDIDESMCAEAREFEVKL